MMNTEKKQYTAPWLEIIRFDAKDIITTSGTGGGGGFAPGAGGFYGEEDCAIESTDELVF